MVSLNSKRKLSADNQDLEKDPLTKIYKRLDIIQFIIIFHVSVFKHITKSYFDAELHKNHGRNQV